MTKTTLPIFKAADIWDLAQLVSHGGDDILSSINDKCLIEDGFEKDEIDDLERMAANAPLLISKLQSISAQLTDDEARNRAVADSPTKLSALLAERVLNTYHALANG
jgi:hypothetical protein